MALRDEVWGRISVNMFIFLFFKDFESFCSLEGGFSSFLQISKSFYRVKSEIGLETQVFTQEMWIQESNPDTFTIVEIGKKYYIGSLSTVL